MGYLDPPDYPDPPCEVCGLDPGACVCPECPACGEQGNPACQQAHGLDVSHIEKFVPAPEESGDPGDLFSDVDEMNRCRGCNAACETVYCAGCAKTQRCPHGCAFDGDCSKCDAEGDRAFDTAREDRAFGRDFWRF